MLAIERRNEILKEVQTGTRVLVGELSARFDVTEETIRRDLEKLERAGWVKRTYGGAVLHNADKAELSHSVRKKTNVNAKQKIARTVQRLVNDGDHIMLDDSSTAYFAAMELRKKSNLTVITNSLEIITSLADVSGWNLISSGGVLREGSLSLIGSRAEQTLREYHVDKAIISCKGLSENHGFTDSSEPNAQIKKAIISAANQTILVADSSKFDKISFVRIGDLQQVSAVVTDKDPGSSWRQTLDTLQVDCIFQIK